MFKIFNKISSTNFLPGFSRKTSNFNLTKKMAATENVSFEESKHIYKDECIFCKYAQKKDPNQEYLYFDDDVFVIPDIKPHAPVHLLVIPRTHIANPKVLKRRDVDLVKRLRAISLQVLKDKGATNEQEMRFGYHWPPLVTVDHLHMHAFYPVSEMNFFCRNGIFKPGFLFVTPEWLINRLESMPSEAE